MATVDRAREYITAHYCDLTSPGDACEGWTVVARDYIDHKHAVCFRIVVADPDGDLWSYTIAEHRDYGTDLQDVPVPVAVVTETRTVIGFRPRLIPHTPEERA